MTMKIDFVLCRAGTMNNYSYILTDKASKLCAVVDPSEAAPIEKKCAELHVHPSFLLNTHHHFDHTDANLPLKQKFGAKIVAPKKEEHLISGVDIALSEDDIFNLGETSAKIIETSGHTLGHVLYYFEKNKALFTGDTLFNLCIGGIFEGTAEQMWYSLQKIKSLPDDVMFYAGHEYTGHAIDMASHLSKNKSAVNKYAQNAIIKIRAGQPVCPVSLGEEKICNPYLAASTFEEFLSLCG